MFAQTTSADHLGFKQESNLKIINRIIERCQKLEMPFSLCLLKVYIGTD